MGWAATRLLRMVQRRDRLQRRRLGRIDRQRRVVIAAGIIGVAGLGIDIAQRDIGGGPRRIGHDGRLGQPQRQLGVAACRSAACAWLTQGIHGHGRGPVWAGFGLGGAKGRGCRQQGSKQKRNRGRYSWPDHRHFAAARTMRHSRPCVLFFRRRFQQSGAVKAVRAGGRRAGAEIPGKSGRDRSGPAFRQVKRRQSRDGGREGRHPVLVLGRQDGTGGIDQPPARAAPGPPPGPAAGPGCAPVPPAAPGVSRQRSSGWRRQVPVPLQGASTNTRSNRPAGLGMVQRQGLDDGGAGAGGAASPVRTAPRRGRRRRRSRPGSAWRRPRPGSCRPRPPPGPAPACRAVRRARADGDLGRLVLEFKGAGFKQRRFRQVGGLAGDADAVRRIRRGFAGDAFAAQRRQHRIARRLSAC